MNKTNFKMGDFVRFRENQSLLASFNERYGYVTGFMSGGVLVQEVDIKTGRLLKHFFCESRQMEIKKQPKRFYEKHILIGEFLGLICKDNTLKVGCNVIAPETVFKVASILRKNKRKK